MGLTGEMGARGDAGPQGPSGNNGIPGEDGRKGERGETGPQGQPGINGQNGQDGKHGKDGQPGGLGRAGPAGPRGLVGPPGPTGQEGPEGREGCKGEDGIPGEDGRPGEPGLRGEDGICTQECKPTQQVAFFAGLSNNCNARGEAIPFDAVMTNQCEGCDGDAATEGAYSGDTGSFTAPYDGTYTFHVHVLRCQNSGALFVHLMKNQDMVSSATNQDVRFETTSCTAILELKAGDCIWVRLRQGAVYGHSPSHYSTFSGFR